MAAALGGLGTVEPVRVNRIRVTVPAARLREAIETTQRLLACDHFVQIAVVDTKGAFELSYTLTGPHRTLLSLRVELSRDRPAIPSIYDLVPPAGLYERQIHDLFGIAFEGHPDLRRLILTEEWPEGEYPLRKDWTMDPKKSYGGVPKEVE